MRFRTNERRSLRSYVMWSAVIYEFMAPVIAQSARTKPTIVRTRLDPALRSARSSDSRRRFVASAGMNARKWSIRLVIVSGDAMSVKRPTVTISTEGIAKKVL